MSLSTRRFAAEVGVVARGAGGGRLRVAVRRFIRVVIAWVARLGIALQKLTSGTGGVWGEGGGRDFLVRLASLRRLMSWGEKMYFCPSTRCAN